jgi:hypothetical protein
VIVVVVVVFVVVGGGGVVERVNEWPCMLVVLCAALESLYMTRPDEKSPCTFNPSGAPEEERDTEILEIQTRTIKPKKFQSTLQPFGPLSHPFLFPQCRMTESVGYLGTLAGSELNQ